MTMLRIMLFCSGNGAAPYRPESDSTQWWNRRDALVRCVASSLPFANELLLYFNEDQTVLHMFFENGSDQFCPTERNVIGLWKLAASKPETTVKLSHVSCRFERHGTVRSMKRESSCTGQDGRSKRDILEALQKSASIEFLREHRLNSSAQVILRKVSREKLVSVERLISRKRFRTEEDPLEKILRVFLHPASIAVTLHESSRNELACWGKIDSTKQTTATMDDICLFLGAVRDMTDQENKILRKVCPNVQAVRLGPVAEFTSKILTVAGFHHYHGRLVAGLSHQCNTVVDDVAAPTKTLLHFALTSDMPSTDLSSDLSKRNRALWCLVRCVVTALWRSKLGMKSSENSRIASKVTISYADSVYQDLTQDQLVPSMAEAHQAAPSEYQILEALVRTPMMKSNPLESSTFDRIIEFKADKCDVRQSAYDALTPGCSNESPVAVLIHLPLERTTNAKNTLTCVVPPVHGNKILQVQTHMLDGPAALITMTQHMAYQNRLLPLLEVHRGSAKK